MQREAPSKLKLLSPSADEDPSDQLEGVTTTEYDESARTAGFASSVVNLVNTIIGSGVLALPFAFHLTGVVIGNIFLMLVALLSVLSVNLLLMAERGAAVRGVVSSYSSLAQLSLGKAGRILTDLALFLNCFGAMTSYLIILADLIEPIVRKIAKDDTLPVRRIYVISAALIVLLPLSAMRKMDALSFTSALAMCSIVYLVGVIIFEGSNNIRDEGFGDLDLAKFSSDFLRTIPIICYSFGAHLNVLPVFSELKNPSFERYKKVSGVTHIICYVAYAVVGTFGYFGFYGATEDNILNNDFAMNNIAVMIARGGICVTVLFSFPVLCFPALVVVEGFFFPGKPFNRLRHWLILLPIIAAEVVIAVFVQNVSLLFGLTGSIASTTICFILPATFFLRLAKAPDNTKFMRGVAWAMVVIGIGFLVASTIVTLTASDPDQFETTFAPTAAPTMPTMAPTDA